MIVATGPAPRSGPDFLGSYRLSHFQTMGRIVPSFNLRFVTMLLTLKSEQYSGCCSRATHCPSSPEIIQKLGCRGNAGDEQVVPSTRAGNVKQVALGVVDLPEVRAVGDGFDSLLKRNHFIVTTHDCYGAEFQSLCEMHRAHGQLAGARFDLFVEYFQLTPCFLSGFYPASDLLLRSHNNANLVRQDTIRYSLCNPLADFFDLLLIALANADIRIFSIEDIHDSAPILHVSVNVRDLWSQQTIGLHSDLV